LNLDYLILIVDFRVSGIQLLKHPNIQRPERPNVKVSNDPSSQRARESKYPDADVSEIKDNQEKSKSSNRVITQIKNAEFEASRDQMIERDREIEKKSKDEQRTTTPPQSAPSVMF
jgi:hypothetical protein